MNSLVTQARVYEDASATIMARVEDRPAAYLTPGAPILSAAVSAVALTVKSVADNSIVAGFDSKPLAVADVWFDALQPWSRDARGHNFRYTLSPGAFPAAETEYRVDVQITLADGRIGFVVFDVTTETTN